VTERVHRNGSFIFKQLFAFGRGAEVSQLQEDGPFDYVSSSPTPLSGSIHIPRELTREEIKEYIQLFVKASENAIEAGFDGVEIHG
jgi:NADPH2 dehydrogenase